VTGRGRPIKEKSVNSRIIQNRAFSLIELLVIIVVIGILAATALQWMSASVDNIRRAETERELEAISRAIVGDPSLLKDGIRYDFGYIGDIGAFPQSLRDLAVNPGGWTTWKGPYLSGDFLQDTIGYRVDAWGQSYNYNGGITVVSQGSGENITKKIADAASDYLFNTFSGSVRDADNLPPGVAYDDSIIINLHYPDDSGQTRVLTTNPDSLGYFTLDSLPVGNHDLEIIFLSRHDTLFRQLTILPRHKSDKDYRFPYSFSEIADDSEIVTIGGYILSTSNDATLGGVTFSADDLAEYDAAADIAARYLHGDTVFSGNEDIDAFHILNNGHIILSTASNASIGSLNFGDDDLVEFNPETGIATVYLSGSVFSTGSENIDAVYVMDNGIIVLSTDDDARIGSLDFGDDDLVAYNKITSQISLLFDGANFTESDEDIDGVHILENGHIILTTREAATLGGLTFGADDLVEYDPISDSAWMYFSGGSGFSQSNENVDACYIGSEANGGYSHLSVVKSSVTAGVAGACNRLYFTVENWTTGPISISSLTLTWSSPLAFYEDIRWAGSQVFYSPGDRSGTGEISSFTGPVIINAGSSAAVQLRNFRSSPSGGGVVNMPNVAFTVQLSDGSIFNISTGGCP